MVPFSVLLSSDVTFIAVSYTHLDVYKRQVLDKAEYDCLVEATPTNIAVSYTHLFQIHGS